MTGRAGAVRVTTDSLGKISLRHPVRAGFAVPLGGDLLRFGPELDGAAAGDVPDAELGFVPAAEGERLPWHGHADIHPDHPRAGALHDLPRGARSEESTSE